jgi:hypothetical protein
MTVQTPDIANKNAPSREPRANSRIVRFRMAIGDGFDEDEDVAQGPALDLDLGTVRAQPGRPDIGHEVGDGFDEDDPPPVEALDLELGGAAPAPQHASPQHGAGARPEQAAPREAIARPGPPAAAPVEIDPFEVRALADYGPDPKGIVAAIPYAFRVLTRQRELKRALETVRQSLREAEAKRDERLIELGTLLKPIILSNPAYSSIASSIGSAEKVVSDREQALAETNSAFREKAMGIDAQIAQLDPSIAAARAKIEERTRAFEDADRLRQKHEARRKRVEIDVRGAQAKLAALETSAADRTAAQQLIAMANQERETRAAEERLAQQAAQAAEAELATARSNLEQIEGQLEALRKKRRLLEQEFSRQGAVRSEGVDAASKDVRNVLLEVGRKTWHEGPDVEGAAMRRKGVTDAEAQVKRLQVEMEKHVRALGAADKTAVRNGLIVVGAAVFILLASFIAWRALRTNPYLPSDQQPKSALIRPLRHV